MLNKIIVALNLLLLVSFIGCGNSSTSTCTGNACPEAPTPMNSGGENVQTKKAPLVLSRYLQQMQLNTLSTKNVEPSLNGPIKSISGDFIFSGSEITDRGQLKGIVVFYDFQQVSSSCATGNSSEPTFTMELIDSDTQASIQAPVSPARQEVTINFSKNYILRVTAKLPAPCTSFNYSFVVLLK